jgi:hypothetical protein
LIKEFPGLPVTLEESDSLRLKDPTRWCSSFSVDATIRKKQPLWLPSFRSKSAIFDRRGI